MIWLWFNQVCLLVQLTASAAPAEPAVDAANFQQLAAWINATAQQQQQNSAQQTQHAAPQQHQARPSAHICNVVLKFVCIVD